LRRHQEVIRGVNALVGTANGSRGLLRAICVSCLIIGSLAGIGLVAQEAAATTSDFYNMNGYQGNSVVYLTTGLTDLNQPYLIADSSNSADDYLVGFHDAINVGSGGKNYAAQGQVFDEYYKTNTSELIVDIPIVAAGAGLKGYQNGGSTFNVAGQRLSLSLGGVPASGSTAGADFLTSFNSGRNVTGQSSFGTKRDDAIYQLVQDLAGFLPTVGFVIGGPTAIRDAEQLQGVDNAQLGVTGPGSAYEYFKVVGGGTQHVPDQNVFTSQAIVQVHIPSTLFTSYRPTIGVSGVNVISGITGSGFITYYDGATGSFSFNSYPAALITGTVTQNGNALKNQPIVLSTYTTSPTVTINYHLTTNNAGRYRFFAPLDTPFQLLTTYSSAFGSATAFTYYSYTPTSADTLILNLDTPYIYGQVISSGPGNRAIPGASVVVSDSGGKQYATSTDSFGNYVVSVTGGTYTVTSSRTGYSQSTKPVPVNGNQGFLANLALTPQSPDFFLSSCSSLSMYTNSPGGCYVYLASNEGWSGTVTLSATITPGGPTVAQPSPPSVGLAAWDLQKSSWVAVTAGSTTGTFTVTVTATSGSISHTVTFTVYVSSPPPPPPCCRPNACCI